MDQIRLRKASVILGMLGTAVKYGVKPLKYPLKGAYRLIGSGIGATAKYGTKSLKYPLKSAYRLMGGGIGTAISGGLGASAGMQAYKDTGNLAAATVAGIGSALGTSAVYGASSAGVKGLSRLVPGAAGKFLNSGIGSTAAFVGLSSIPQIAKEQERFTSGITAGLSGIGGYLADTFSGNEGKGMFDVAQNYAKAQKEAQEVQRLASEGEASYLDKLADMQLLQGVRNSIPIISTDTIKEKMDMLRRQIEIEERYRNPGILGMNPIV